MVDDPAQLSSEFGRRLTALRVAAGLSQRQLARSLGHEGPDAISRYERGLREPRISAVVALANALQVPLTSLVPDPSPRVANPATSEEDSLLVRLRQTRHVHPKAATAAIAAAIAVLDVLE